MRKYELKCGCVVENGEREKYAFDELGQPMLCPPHKAENDERRARAAADYRASHPDSEFKEVL